ncbi:MAG: hypothetical protein J7604_16890 [Sporocytophaga sp.]|uniref:hypothetical protein n=1 Tax=Sporocytophaga sp. TaxID=2231183 RepID=UPI001B21347D|nr:hypothetical protein [Sporocytophaga sp.]MBO9701887.1 hypothetical protein [Sporocytophaga sp.]
MKRVLIVIIFFCFQSCSVKEKENAEVETAKDSSGTQVVADSDKVSSETINLDKLLNVTKTDSISINRINEKTFELDQSSLFFLAFSRNKIAANLYEEQSLIDVYNPFTGKVYNQIDLSKYSKEFIKENVRGGYAPSETRLGRNNIGQVKIMITDGTDVPFSAFFAISNLELSNLKTQTLGLEQNVDKLSITEYNKVFDFQDLFLYHDTLFNVDDLDEITISNGAVNLYKMDISKNEMTLGNSNVIKGASNYNILRFPYKDKLFFTSTNSNYTDLFGYNIITGESKKYVIPLSPSQFYFAEDGFFIANMPGGQESNEMYRYSFVPY